MDLTAYAESGFSRHEYGLEALFQKDSAHAGRGIDGNRDPSKSIHSHFR